MTLPPPKVCERIGKLFAMVGSPNDEEAHTARGKLNQLFVEHGLTWNDLPTIFAAIGTSDSSADVASEPRAGPSSGAAVAPAVNVLDLVLALIEEHFAITADELLGVALWVLHTYVFDRFSITPRLALLSPVHGCGKTTLLTLIEQLVAEGNRIAVSSPKCNSAA